MQSVTSKLSSWENHQEQILWVFRIHTHLEDFLHYQVRNHNAKVSDSSPHPLFREEKNSQNRKIFILTVPSLEFKRVCNLNWQSCFVSRNRRIALKLGNTRSVRWSQGGPHRSYKLCDYFLNQTPKALSGTKLCWKACFPWSNSCNFLSDFTEDLKILKPKPLFITSPKYLHNETLSILTMFCL